MHYLIKQILISARKLLLLNPLSALSPSENILCPIQLPVHQLHLLHDVETGHHDAEQHVHLCCNKPGHNHGKVPTPSPHFVLQLHPGGVTQVHEENNQQDKEHNLYKNVLEYLGNWAEPILQPEGEEKIVSHHNATLPE